MSVNKYNIKTKMALLEEELSHYNTKLGRESRNQNKNTDVLEAIHINLKLALVYIRKTVSLADKIKTKKSKQLSDFQKAVKNFDD